MEGKALFYAQLVGVNAVPIVLDADDPEAVIDTVIRLAPGFSGIHLEDIATPGVYHIERELEKRLHIPVFHDDQHGTAVVVAAAIISAARFAGKDLADLRFGQVGLGAAGSAIAGLASGLGFGSVTAFDPMEGGVERLRQVADDGIELDCGTDDDHFRQVVATADVLVLTTGRPGLLTPDMVQPGQIIMALTNPIAEITPQVARAAGASVAADGSIVNNVLSYPGLFKGALDARAPAITRDMKRAAAFAIADATAEDRLLPDALDLDVHAAVAAAVAAAAASGR
jgi:malate dehydrogenase (oxaloacetate-decarboxylating)